MSRIMRRMKLVFPTAFSRFSSFLFNEIDVLMTAI